MKHQKTNDLNMAKDVLKNNAKFKARLAEYGLQPQYGATHHFGPEFITKHNVANVEKYEGQYR